MKNRLQQFVLAFAVALMHSQSMAAAALPDWRFGQLKMIHADPGDVVLTLNQAGPCGSSFYHIRKTNANFKEFYSLMLTAFSTGMTVNLYVVSCENDRNILSHGNAMLTN